MDNYTNKPKDIFLLSFLLGMAFTFGVLTNIIFPNWAPLGNYIALLSIFHSLEYFITAVFNPNNVTTDGIQSIIISAFLLNHSLEYNLSFAAAILEFITETLFFSTLKAKFVAKSLGFLLIIIGQTCRSLAMIHGGSNFSHQIKETRDNSHKLVTRGIYA